MLRDESREISMGVAENLLTEDELREIESEVMEELEDEEKSTFNWADADDVDMEDDGLGADELGTLVNLDDEGIGINSEIEVEEEDSFNIIKEIQHGFINKDGDIQVMDQTIDGDNFTLKLVDIDKIAIVKRIRKNQGVEDLYTSIRNTGLIQPITVAPTVTEGFYVLLDGYRRILACGKAGIRKIPAVVNLKVNTTEIPILEAMYNHSKKYTIGEMIDHIDYLENEKSIVSATMIEYLLQMESGEYTKLKDILEDDDPDIVDKLMNGIFTISQAFKALEKRRKQESKELQDAKKANKVYADKEGSGADQIDGMGDTGDEEIALTDEEIKSLSVNLSTMDSDLDEMSLDDMVAEGKQMEGFGAKHQEVGNRECLDPALRKSVIARDENKCKCCKRGGTTEWVDMLDVHHVVPVFADNKSVNDISGDRMENLVSLCLICHRSVHLYAYGDLHISPERTQEELDLLTKEEMVLYKEERERLKRVVKLGNVIRQTMQLKGIKRADAKKNYSARNIGRNMPGKNRQNPDI